MKISDLKPGQIVMIGELPYEYQGIHKVRIPNIGSAQKRVFKATGSDHYKYFNLTEGSKTLKSEKINLVKRPQEKRSGFKRN